jgi:hypothetical protein
MPSDPWNQTAPREPGPRSNREHLHRRELARRNWPNLAMAGSMLVGFLAGLVVLNTVRPATELAANLLLGGCVVGVMALAFTPLVFAGRTVAPRIRSSSCGFLAWPWRQPCW